jgi:hypothetical protein
VPTSLEWEVASITTVLDTQLNSLANGSYTAAGSAYDNTPGGPNNYTGAIFELVVTFGSNATANTTVDLYATVAVDGGTTNYADAPSSTNPATDIYIGSFICRAATAHRMTVGSFQNPVRLPPFSMKFYAKNGAGVAFPASNSTIKMVALRLKAV